MTPTLDDLRWHDRYKLDRILGQLKDGLSVAIFLTDGSWKGESIQKSSVRYRRTCVLNERRSETLLGVYKVTKSTSVSDLGQIILQDLHGYKALALKNVR